MFSLLFGAEVSLRIFDLILPRQEDRRWQEYYRQKRHRRLGRPHPLKQRQEQRREDESDRMHEFWNGVGALAAPALRVSLRSSSARRYWGILSVALQRAVADLLDDLRLAEFTSLLLPSPDTILRGINASVDTPDVCRLHRSIEDSLSPRGVKGRSG